MLTALDSLRENDAKADAWLAGITLSEAALRNGSLEQGYAAIMQSVKTAKELVGELPDKDYEKSFLAKPEFKRLASQALKLRQALNID